MHTAQFLDVNKEIKRENRLCLPHTEISTLSAISGVDILQRSEYVSLDSLSESDFRRSPKVKIKQSFQNNISIQISENEFCFCFCINGVGNCQQLKTTRNLRVV